MFQADNLTNISLVLGSMSVVLGFIIWGARLTWWLSEQFKETRGSLYKLLDNHEDKDQHRHEDNLVRFTRIETLIKNGH
jgi:hypothetical protein